MRNITLFFANTTQALCLALVYINTTHANPSTGLNWTSAGGNIHNTANADTENKLSPSNVNQLTVKWIHKTAPDGSYGDVSAAPAILGNRVYINDWAGNLTALDTKTGQVIWKKIIRLITLPTQS